MKTFTFRCATCDEIHQGLPDISFMEPDYTFGIGDRESRVKWNSELCMLDEEHFFIRCLLRIPIIGEDAVLGWGVWVSASEENFQRYVERVEQGRETEMEPWFGWLSNRLPFYEDTLKLKANVHPQGSDERPLVQLEPTDHPLSLHQRNGMPLELAIRIAQASLHTPSPIPANG